MSQGLHESARVSHERLRERLRAFLHKLRSVSRRLRLVAVGRRSYAAFLISAGLYAVVLLISRLAGVIPEKKGFRARIRSMSMSRLMWV